MALRNSPQGQSLIIAAMIFILFVAGIVIMNIFEILNSLVFQIVFGIVLFVLCYIVVHRMFLNYVEKRINPIFKTIHNVTLSPKEVRRKIDTVDLADELKDDVNIWAIKQENEIQQLRELENYRKDFLGNVSHELKTPIFNIQGYILTLLDGGLDDKKINKLYLQRTEKSINRMISIVDDLGSISRLESGEFKLNITEFNLVKLVEDIFESHEMLVEKYNVKLEFDRNYNKPVKVLADRKRITEVLNNLLGNSLKYGKSNGKAKVGFVDAGDKILVDVSDNGIGISEDDLPRIFERFYRVDKSRSRDSGGTGLGLAIVKHIIQAHDQSINVRSKTGKGSSFIFSLDKA